jgi:hypothetical protein
MCDRAKKKQCEGTRVDRAGCISVNLTDIKPELATDGYLLSKIDDEMPSAG